VQPTSSNSNKTVEIQERQAGENLQTGKEVKTMNPATCIPLHEMSLQTRITKRNKDSNLLNKLLIYLIIIFVLLIRRRGVVFG